MPGARPGVCAGASSRWLARVLPPEVSGQRYRPASRLTAYRRPPRRGRLQVRDSWEGVWLERRGVQCVCVALLCNKFVRAQAERRDPTDEEVTGC